MSENQNPAQAENREPFEALLDAYGYAEFEVARSLKYDASQEKQKILDYVKRLQANQIIFDRDSRISKASMQSVYDAFDAALQNAYAKAAEHPELDWTFEIKVNRDGKPFVESKGTPRKGEE